MKPPVTVAIILGLITLNACDRRESNDLVPSANATAEVVTARRDFWIHSEEIQNTENLNRGGKVRVVPDPIVPHATMPLAEVEVQLPGTTPFQAGSIQEILYLKGFALGYLDAHCSRAVCRSNAGDRLKVGWDQGWKEGYSAAAKRPEA